MLQLAFMFTLGVAVALMIAYLSKPRAETFPIYVLTVILYPILFVLGFFCFLRGRKDTTK